MLKNNMKLEKEKKPISIMGVFTWIEVNLAVPKKIFPGKRSRN